LFKNFKPKTPSNFAEDFLFIEKAEIVADYVKTLLTQYQVDVIAIEQTNGSRNRTTQKFLEFIHFAVLATIDRECCRSNKVVYVDSSKWRSICGQYMNKDQCKHNQKVRDKKAIPMELCGIKASGKITKKHLSVAWVNQKFGLHLKLKDNDAADAISMAYAAMVMATTPKVPPVDVDKLLSSG
jgi:Holliday junction resolvasome RuvABC endonuclease subunit